MPNQTRTEIGKRWTTFNRIRPRLAALVAIAGLLLAGLRAWRDEFRTQWQPPLLADVVGVLPWWAWALIGLAIGLVVLFEASHRELTRVDLLLADAQRDIESIRREHEAKLPVLQMLGPYSRISEVDTDQLPLWYVVVENTQPGSVARNVRVRMDRPDPQIIMSFPVDLHRMHDNDKPFKKVHDIRYGEPETFDLFACGLNADNYYLYRADGDESSQLGPEWMLSGDDDAIISHAIREPYGWTFDVIATPDPPALRAVARLCLKMDGGANWPCLGVRDE